MRSKAVAVANARRDGVLPKADAQPMPNDLQLRRMLSDLRRLNSRLNGGRKAMFERPRSFSLVLVGPGLWSHFHGSPSAILARYHTTGPLTDKVTVITHHVVLQSLLNGGLSVEEASSRDLLAYADGDTAPVREMFRLGLGSRS